jgi:hypothetical protein
MKRNIIAILLVLSLATVGVFADPPNPNPANTSFDIITSVQGINYMKITTAEFTSTAPGDFISATTYAGPLEVTTYGTQNFSAWLSTMSNNRSGYTVTMTANAMKSEIEDLSDAYIDFTVTVNTKAITTEGTTSSPASVAVITAGSMTGLSKQSHKIALSVDQETFEAAVEGDYTGTVTFNYVAN